MPKLPTLPNGSDARNFKLIYAAIAALLILTFLGVFFLVKSKFQTQTYYVLNQDVPTRTQVTTSMLSPVTITEGKVPQSYSISDVQSGYMYTRFALNKGDVLTSSNTGPYQEDISVGIPDSWVVTSFSVSADDAVGGRITRGTYFDMMVATPTGSFYPFVNILTLDTTVSLNSASSSNAVNTSAAHAGQTSQYVVGMDPADAAELQQIMKKYSGNIKLVLSPMQNGYKAPDINAYNGIWKYTDGDLPKNMGKGTDSGFTPVQRKNGVPVNVQADCSTGNVKIACSSASASPTASASPSK